MMPVAAGFRVQGRGWCPRCGLILGSPTGAINSSLNSTQSQTILEGCPPPDAEPIVIDGYRLALVWRLARIAAAEQASVPPTFGRQVRRERDRPRPSAGRVSAAWNARIYPACYWSDRVPGLDGSPSFSKGRGGGSKSDGSASKRPGSALSGERKGSRMRLKPTAIWGMSVKIRG